MDKRKGSALLLAAVLWMTSIPGAAWLPQQGEEMSAAQKLEQTKQYTDRFIVRYAAQQSTGLERQIGQAFEAAKAQKRQVLPEWETFMTEANVMSMAEAEAEEPLVQLTPEMRAVLRPQREQMETEEAAGGVTVLLEEKVDPEVFIAELIEQGGEQIAYIQPDYIMELSEEDGDGTEDQASVPQETPLPEETEPVEAAEGGAAVQQVEITLQPPEENAAPAQVGAQEIPGGMQITVAVLDSAVDVTHPDLAGRVLDGYDFCNDTADLESVLQDMEAVHGTHVAGTIAQAAPEAVIMPLTVFRNGKAYTSDIIRAIDYAKDHGAQIVNCSWGSAENNLALREAVEASGLFFVCAAGNRRTNVDQNPVYPACFGLENTLSVAALNEDFGMSYFSNYGAQQVDIAALGRNHSAAYPGGGYDTMSGTSVSAAVVTGAAAQFAAVYGTQQLKVSLTYSADKLSCLEGKVKGAAALNVQRLLAGEEGEERQVQPEDDFDVLAPPLSEEESWELFAQGDNVQAEASGSGIYILKSNGTLWLKIYGKAPQQIVGLRNIVAISADMGGMIAVDKNGKVYTDGWHQDVSQEIAGISNVLAVSSGSNYFLALKKDGTVWGWGQNESGQTGYDGWDEIYGGFLSNSAPEQVKTLGGALSGIKKIRASQSTSFAIAADGTAYRWGIYSKPWEFTSGAEAFTENIQEITTAGDLLCVALDKSGQMHFYENRVDGDGFVVSHNAFRDVAGISGNTVVKEDGTVWYWSGQGEAYTVQRVSGINNVRQVSQHGSYVVAVKTDGTIWDWSYTDGTCSTPGQMDVPTLQQPARQTIEEENYREQENPAAYQDQKGLEALGWSEYYREYPGENDWQTPSLGEFSAESGQLIVKKTGSTNEPSGAPAHALAYAVEKTFTRRQENWNGDERISLWTQNFKGDYEVVLDGMFQQQGGHVYYEVMGKTAQGYTSVVARYRVDPYVTGAFNVYNYMLNEKNTTVYPLWTNSQKGRVISTILHSSDSTFQTFVDGSLIPASTSVKDAHPADTFSMTGYGKADPGAYITGIRINAQKQAHVGDTIAKLNKLSFREISKIRDITDDAAQQMSMNMLTSMPEAVTGSLNALPSNIAGAAVTWHSSHPQVLTDSGTYVAQPFYNTEVIMTAKLVNPADKFTQYVDFRLTVPGSTGEYDKSQNEKILVEERYADANNNAYHLNQQGLEALGWSEPEEANKTGNNWQTPSLGSFSAESGKLVMKKTGSTGEPASAAGQALCYAVEKTFTHWQNNWKGDPHISVWTQNFKGDYDIEIDASFHQTGSTAYYDILGGSAYGTDTIVGRYAIQPGINGTFSVYNNKLNGGTGNTYPLWIDPGQQRSIKTSLHSQTATFQTFLNGSARAAQTTAANANPKDTFSMTGWNQATPGAYIKGIRFSAQKQAGAGDTIVMLNGVKLIERQAQRDGVDDALDQLSMSMLTDTPDFVTGNLKPLPATLTGMQVTWTSNRPELMSDSGELLQDVVFDETVVMTAKITNPQNGFTKYADFTLRLVKKQGFAQKFTQNVIGEPSSGGQPGSLTLPEIEGWTFRYPGISNGMNGQIHDAQILVRDEALIFKKISDRQTASYQPCLEGIRPLSRTEKQPKWEGKYDLSFKAKARGTGTFRFAPLSSSGVQPFQVMLDASTKKVRISYGKEENGTWQQVQQEVAGIDPTIEHDYRFSIDTTGQFVVYVDGTAIETADGAQSRGFLPGTGSYFNLSQMYVWITNITMEDTEMGFLKDIVFSPVTSAAPPAEINIPVESGADLEVKVLARGVQNLNQTTFTVVYPEELLEIVDAAGAVYGVGVQPGVYGNIEVTAVDSGSVSFRVISPVTHAQQRWTGVLNVLKFHAVGNGNTRLEVRHASAN